MNTEIAVLSRIGGRGCNEDACGWLQVEGTICCVLSDGAGGHGGGDVASRLAVSVALDAFALDPASTGDAALGLVDRAHVAVVTEQGRGGVLADMRATIVVLVLDRRARRAVWAHVGDSRLYCFRDGRVAAQTRDHSFVQSLIDAGFMKPEQRRGSPERNVLTASLGSVDACDADVSAEPFVVAPGDAFLLCTDGLWDYVDEQTMLAHLERAESPDDWLGLLEQEVLAHSRSGQDNYSAVAIWCDIATDAGEPLDHG